MPALCFPACDIQPNVRPDNVKKRTACRLWSTKPRGLDLIRETGTEVKCRQPFRHVDRMVDPNDNDRLHDSDWATGRVAWAVKLAIVGGVEKAWSLGAANIS